MCQYVPVCITLLIGGRETVFEEKMKAFSLYGFIAAKHLVLNCSFLTFKDAPFLGVSLTIFYF